MIEQELIAAVFRRPEVIHEAFVRPEWLQNETYRQIWEQILRLQAQGEPFDAVTVSQCVSPEVANIVIGIANESVGAASSAKSYAERIKAAWRKRAEADIGAALAAGELDGMDAMRQLVELDTEQERFECSFEDALRMALEDMERAAAGEKVGITTGLADLDRVLGGWIDSDLAIVGARPAVGKTALLLHFAQACNVPMGLISAEQPRQQIAQRHVASLGKVSLTSLRQGKVGEREMNAVITARHRMKHPYLIHDRSSPHIGEIERVARRWHHRHGIKILFVDYVQRIRGSGDKKHEQVGHVVQSLKTIARDLGIPVVALAQVKREVDSRSNRRPNMGDLSDSSEIEKEADQVLTLYRDEVYDDNTPDPGVAEIQICKNRHGLIGTVKASWAGEFVSFGDIWRGAA